MKRGLAFAAALLCRARRRRRASASRGPGVRRRPGAAAQRFAGGAGSRRRAAAVRARPDAADEPGIGDEAGHDVCRARVARPRLSLEDRGLPGGPARRWRAARRPDHQGLRRSEDHDRTVAVVHGGAEGQGARPRRRRPCSRPHVVQAGEARRRGIRQGAAQALQRRTGCAAGQLQIGALRVRAQRGGRCRGLARGARARGSGARCATEDRQRRLRRLARHGGCEVRQPGCDRLRGFRRKLCRGLRRARLVRGAARPSAFRLRHVRHLFPRGGRRVQRRAPGCAGALRRAAVRDARVAAALRHRARREQAVEQRDGAADLPHARHHAPSAAGHARSSRPTSCSVS